MTTKDDIAPAPESAQAVLRSVSRSFGLSIQLLPQAIRAPVALGYLLARATDTVADTTTLPQEERLMLLQHLLEAIAQPQAELSTTSALLAQFERHQTDPHERQLIRALPQYLNLLNQLPPADQASVRSVLGPITEGQMLDVTRFGNGFAALQSEQELEHYAWQVAGCVGAFWTQVCASHLRDWAIRPDPELLEIGQRYGAGLQYLNILLDAGGDLAAGRCYFPQDRLAALGLSPEQLAQAVASGDQHVLRQVQPLFNEYLNFIHKCLQDGLTYSCSLRSRRLRVASVLPALIGIRTLALLRQAGPIAWQSRLKVPRREVRWILWRLFWQGASVKALRQEFERLSTPSAH